jgi:uncharacterized protein with GYD domain
MPIYISRGRFTTDAVKGLMAKPENREQALSKLFKSVGGRLMGWYLTFGPHDWLVLANSLTTKRLPLPYWLRPPVVACLISRPPSR